MARPAETPRLASRVIAELRARGWLLQSDDALPSVAGIVAGEPIRGSWWSHAASNRIFWVLEALEDSPEVLQAKLVRGKLTLVHRALWPQLLAVAGSNRPWQREGLTSAGKSLLTRVRRHGAVRLDRLERWASEVKPGEAARELEARLLASAREVHTESGRHTKELESWEHLRERLGIGESLPDVDDAERELERLVGAEALPWTRSARRRPRARRAARR